MSLLIGSKHNLSSENIQKLTLNKLHGDTKVCNV
jgi:hypothetical protein